MDDSRTLESSRILQELLETIESGETREVLDFGPAVSTTVSFFSPYQCSLTFADLYDVAEPTLRTESQYDLILFWDTLNNLDGESLRQLGRTVRPHTHENTRAHPFVAYGPKTRLPKRSYGIADKRHLLTWQDEEIVLPCPHTQAEITSAFPYLEVGRRTLLAGERVELLLRAR